MSDLPEPLTEAEGASIGLIINVLATLWWPKMMASYRKPCLKTHPQQKRKAFIAQCRPTG